MAGLIQEFNSFGGNSIQEHKKQFQLYINKLSALEESARLEILNNLQCHHRQEELFLTILLLKFEQTKRIKQLILEGDHVLNKLIVQHSPFIFRNEDVSYFMDELFPNVSYIARNKCLNNLAKVITNDKIGEDFFRRVLEKYGLKAAQILLQVSSENCIIENLTKYRIVFPERHLIKLHKRFGSKLILYYYKECSKYDMKDQFGKQPMFASYLTIYDIATYYDLLKYGSPKLSKAGFFSIMKIKKDEIITNPCKYSRIIRPKILHKLLSKEEFMKYFENKLPKSTSKFDLNHINADVGCFKKDERGLFLSNAFKAKYGFDFYSLYSNKQGSENTIPDDLKTLLSPEDILKFEMDDDDKLEFLPPSISFPLIKECINFTSDQATRTKVVMKLFKCARNNDDEIALVDALKYVNQRHKNDTGSIRVEMFEYLRNSYKMNKLSTEIWEELHETILSECMLGEMNYTSLQMLEHELEYNFINGKDATTLAKKVVKLNGATYFYMQTTNKELKKWIILQLPQFYKDIYTEEDDIKRWPSTFMNTIHAWNLTYPNDKINYLHYYAILETCLENYERWHTYDDIFEKGVVCYNTNAPEELKLQAEITEKHIEKFAENVQMWGWLLENRLEVVIKHIDLFLEKNRFIKEGSKLLYKISKMHYTPLPNKVRTRALQILKESLIDLDSDKEISSSACSRRYMALVALSYENDYLDIVHDEKFYPSGNTEVDVHDESFMKLLKLREQTVKCLRNQKHLKDVLPMMMKYCFKDYFSISHSTLAFVMYNLPEKDLTKPLRILQSRSLAVRKRALYLATNLTNVRISAECLKNAGENEKNVSMQKFIFSRTFRNFAWVQNKEAFDLLIAHFRFIFEKDPETHDMVLQFKLVPLVYVASYIEKVWTSFRKTWDHKHRMVLSAISSSTMQRLSNELIDDMIQFNLLHSKKLTDSDIDFIYKYLLLNSENIQHRFNIVSTNARISVDGDLKLDFKEFNKMSKNINFLYKSLCVRLTSKCSDDSDDNLPRLNEKKILVEKLASAIPNLPLPYNHLDYQLHIEICRCYLNDSDKLPELFIELQKDVLEKYGEILLEYFNEFARNQFNSLPMDDELKLNFLNKMMEIDMSTIVKILVIHLMPDDYPNNDLHAQQLRNIIAMIEADSAPSVSLYLNRYLKKLNIS